MINEQAVGRAQAIDFFMSEFGTGKDFARKVLDLLRGLGLIQRKGRLLTLAPDGRTFIKEQNTYELAKLLVGKVEGLLQVLEVLPAGESLEKAAVFDRWRQAIEMPLPRNQFEHRINWLRALGLVDSVARKYYATEAGLKLVAEAKRSGETDPDKQRAISHSDIEEKLVVIGEFFEFEATKRPSINTVLPSYAVKLSQGDRQLDCLWVRFVHFGGKMKFPIEVHVGGNMADTLDRLETVCDFVQKAVLVTSEDQEKQIIDRLKVKRSRLLDKLVIIGIDDVYKAAEATNVLRSFTSRLFSD